jgi:hypothetical protein
MNAGAERRGCKVFYFKLGNAGLKTCCFGTSAQAYHMRRLWMKRFSHTARSLPSRAPLWNPTPACSTSRRLLSLT